MTLAFDSPELAHLPLWKATIVAMPWVCERCSRRFPRYPVNGHCPTHLPTKVKVSDQTDLAAKFSAPDAAATAPGAVPHPPTCQKESATNRR